MAVKPRPPTKRKQASSAPGLLGKLAWAAALLAVWAYFLLAPGQRAPPEVTPLAAPRLAALPQFRGCHAERLLWGTYRSGQYLGLRTRTPRSLLAGLMWFDPDRPDALDNIRHNAQERDKLTSYGWRRHDGVSYGDQQLLDGGLRLRTRVAKRWCEGCGLGGDWAINLQAAAEPGASPAGAEGGAPEGQQRVSLLFYLANEEVTGGRGTISILPRGALRAGETLAASGNSYPIGPWELHMVNNLKTGTQLGRVRHLGEVTGHLHNLTDLVRQRLAPRAARHPQAAPTIPAALQLPNSAAPGANLAVIQLTATLPLDLDLVLLSGLPAAPGAPAARPSDCPALAGAPGAQPESPGQRLAALSGAALRRLLREREAQFDARFARTFGSLEGADTPAGTEAVARAALSNLLGGVGYFYGTSDIALPEPAGAERLVRSWPAPLFTAVPSRSFFPRGFLWDEGFHQLLVRRWDAALSRDILAHWLDLTNQQGWIAREQILGEEARARVPAEFIVQKPDLANPPTLFLPLADMARAVAAGLAQPNSSSAADTSALQDELEFVKAAWPRLQAWYGWFNRTQAGPVPGSWRWRGRDPDNPYELNPKTLTSGLDDYPRASHPDSQERHLDLRAWMALASRALATIAAAVGLPAGQVAPYQEAAAGLGDLAGLNALHRDPASGQYLDWGNHTEAVALAWHTIMREDGIPVGRELRRVVTDGRPPRPQLVPQFGYNSLFPLLMRLLPPDSAELGEQLALLARPDLLWSASGLRSLAASASLYGAYNTEHSGPYWRGAVWLNINYLALAALDHYAQAGGPHAGSAQRLHDELRRNLLSNLVGQYNSSGYLWENYSDQDGHGQGSHPFTGWTALLVLIAGRTYPTM